MASAAAVGANIALSPDTSTLREPDTPGGTVASAIIPPDEPIPDAIGEEDDEDDDIVPKAKRRVGKVNQVDEEEAEEELEDGDDLFGDVGEDDEEPAKRQLEDEELDSGDDEGRNDRIASEAAVEMETQEAITEYPDFGRQPLPEPSDGEMYLMKVPKFLAIEPQNFDIPSFQPPTTDHHSRKEPSATFSAFGTAMSTIRWRHSPSDPKELQSNARILRWSDGSLTLQLASDPTQQYEIDGNTLAPPQRNPAKPTPTSLKPGQKEGTGHDSYTYLALPNESVGLLRIAHKITAGLSILPSATTTDDALERLQTALAATVKGKNLNTNGGIEFVKIDEDPELAKKKAEVAEREKMRAQKRREQAENRDQNRSNRALGRAGLGSQRYGAGGLTAGMLEDDEAVAARPRAKASKPRRQRRNSEYSEDEDFGRRRGNFGGDEYDVEDDFIAGSDEEEAIEDDDDDDEDEDDGIVEKARSPKRKPEKAAEPSGDEDAEGEEDEDVVQAARTKRRRVIDEDDDDE